MEPAGSIFTYFINTIKIHLSNFMVTIGAS